MEYSEYLFTKMYKALYPEINKDNDEKQYSVIISEYTKFRTSQYYDKNKSFEDRFKNYIKSNLHKNEIDKGYNEFIKKNKDIQDKYSLIFINNLKGITKI